jgi:hypothetical protein
MARRQRPISNSSKAAAPGASGARLAFHDKPAPSGMKRRLRAAGASLLLIVIVALALRAAFLWNYASHNPKQALATIPFLFESGNIATSLATGRGFSSPFRVNTGPTAWTTPVYPAILAALFRIFGTYTFAAFLAACAVNILATALACIPIFYAGKRMGGAAIGAKAAWLWAVFPNAIEIPSTSMWDASLAALLAATILWATIALAESEEVRTDPNAVTGAGALKNPLSEIPWDWVGYGLLWGLAVMTTATLVGLLPFLLGWIAYRRGTRACPAGRSGRPWLKKAVLAVTLMVLCCLPWTVRNYEVFHAFVPMRSILGLQLWVGNNPRTRAIWLGTQHPIHDSAERAKYVAMGEIAYMQQKEREALDYMATHPTREAYLGWKRFLEFWSGGTPTPINDLFRSRSAWFDFVLLFNLLVAIGALSGIVILIRNRSKYWFPLAVFPIVFPWAYYLTVVMPRYSLPVDPAVMLLTVMAIGGSERSRTVREGAFTKGRARSEKTAPENS